MISISYYETKYALNYHYLLCKGCLGKYDSISQAMPMLNRPDEFICQLFDTAIVVEPSKTFHVRFLNQISGITLTKWQWRPTLASRGVHIYYQILLGPDIWFKILVKPVFRPDTIVSPCGNSCNIYIVSYSSHGDALSRLCNCKNLLKYSGSKNMVFIQQNPPVPILLVNTRCSHIH